LVRIKVNNPFGIFLQHLDAVPLEFKNVVLDVVAQMGVTVVD